MSADGAHLGVSAGRAIQSILGGDPPPTEDEQVTREQMEAQIRGRPLPGDGKPPWEGADDDDGRDAAYSACAESLAHAYLVLADERPALLTEERFYDGTEMDDPWWRENMAGKPRDPSSAIWEALKERWPGASEWLGGVSGFQAGWAFNAVRWIKEQPPAPNPALLSVDLPDDAT